LSIPSGPDIKMEEMGLINVYISGYKIGRQEGFSSGLQQCSDNDHIELVFILTKL
jgi:hypothetical protein